MNENLHEVLAPYVDRGLITKKHSDVYPLTLYDYTQKCQYERVWDTNTVRARGLVVDDAGNAVNNPMKKFWNYGEPEAPTIPDDLPPTQYTVTEKLDGSCVMAFLWNGYVITHTRGSFVSAQARASGNWLAAFGTEWMKAGWTYIFEWIAPDNRIVINYGDRRELVLLCAQHLSGDWRLPHTVHEWSGSIPSYLRMRGNDDVAKIKRVIGDDEEGFVLTLHTGERVKIKGEHYLKLHRAVTGLSTYTVWEAVKSGYAAEAEVRRHLDEESRAWFDKTADQLRWKNAHIMVQGFSYIGGASDNERSSRPLFASYVQKNVPREMQSIVFALYDNKEDRATTIAWNMVKPETKDDRFSTGLQCT